MSLKNRVQSVPVGTENRPAGTGEARRGGAPIYRSESLLQGGAVAWIEHGPERYLLRRTRQGKLILTK